MKKIILIIMCSVVLFAQNGKQIYKNSCKVCHIAKKGKFLSKDEKRKLLAPPIFGVVKHTKENYPIKKDFVKFVANYIYNPDIKKAVCKKGAIKKFGLMPAIGKNLTKEQRIEVSKYIYNIKER